jgi:uncharacterized membrane protein YkvA (DUF1232 family)
MATVADPILSRVPPAALSTFTRLLKKEARGLDVLRRSVDRYLEVIEEAAQTRAHINADLARRIAAACHGLLDVHDDVSAQDQARIVAAVEYFLLPRDGDDDLAYQDGLDDDAAVVTVVAEALGRDDLRVDLVPH